MNERHLDPIEQTFEDDTDVPNAHGVFGLLDNFFDFLVSKRKSTRTSFRARSNEFVHFCLSTAHNAFHVVFFVTDGQIRFCSSRKRSSALTTEFSAASTNLRFRCAFADRFFLLNLGFIITGIITR